MRYLSVCSGIEAASVAWAPLGWAPVAFSEIEKFPNAVLRHHYPHVPNWGDMRKFREWPDAVVDVLVGGTPCQSFSVAGLRKGMADPRGNLTLTYLAVADRYRPTWLVWENVPGVLSIDDGRAFGAFVGGLAQLGYGFAYRVLDAQYAGVPQRRRRVFVVGHLGDWRAAAAVLFERHSLSGDSAPRREAREGSTHGVAPSLTNSGRGVERAGDSRGQDPVIAHAPDIARCVAAREGTSQDWETTAMVAHSLRADGFDASEDGTGRGTPLVPVEAFGGNNTSGPIELAAALNAHPGGGRRMDFESETFLTVPFAQNQRDEVRELPGVAGSRASEPGMKQQTYVAFYPTNRQPENGNYENVSPAIKVGSSGSSGNAPAVAIPIDMRQASRGATMTNNRAVGSSGGAPGTGIGEPGDPSPTIASSHTPSIAIQAGALRENPESGPDGVGVRTDDTAFTVEARAEVQAVAFQSSQSGVREVEAHATLDSNNGSRRHNGVQLGMQVRRLTPIECERLQGFKDNYTRIPEREYKNRRITKTRPADRWEPLPGGGWMLMAADGPRYKALGNSMAIPVIRWLGERIALVESEK